MICNGIGKHAPEERIHISNQQNKHDLSCNYTPAIAK